MFQKNKFEYNTNLIEKIDEKNFNNNEFIEMGNKILKIYY